MLEAERIALEGGPVGSPAFAVVDSLDRVVLAESALAGLVVDSTVRGPAWRFLDLGRRLERAVLLLGVVEATLVPETELVATQPLYETVLTALESLVEYRRRHRSDVALDAVLELILVDDANPRSLAFQLDRITEDLAGLPPHPDRDRHASLVEDAARALFDVDRRNVGKVVLDARAPLLELTDAITARWFADQGAGRRIIRRGAG
jgi:uncharacterized alpha-E superfamily protein